MTMRRPKKMARPTGASSSASRLGPGMETVELRFLPEGGWERGLRGDAGHDIKAPTPWVISWEVGAGASVDRGLRLARLKCAGTGADKGAGVAAEHFIIAPREGILTELVVATGGHVFPAQAPPSQDTSPANTDAKAAANLQPPSARGGNTAEGPVAAAATATAAAVAGGTGALAPAEAGAGSAAGGAVVVTGTGTPESVVVGRLSFCSHPELHGTLCTSCGRNVVPPAGKEEGATGGAGGGGRRGRTGGAGGGGRRGRGGSGVDGGEGRGAGGKPSWDSAEGLGEGEVAMMSKVTMRGGGTLTVSSTAARRMHMDKSGRLLNSKKLSLVLDLDNTLLHCSDHPDAGRVSAPGVDGIHSLRLPNQPRDYYIKLRPGLRQFLAQAATMFEMTIYTAGTSQYADAVAGVLDPDRSLFQGRHFSTCYTPDLGRNTKSLERIFPCGLDMALIVDDRDDVWRGEQAKNLLLVRPYKFFVGQRSVPSGATHDTGGQQLPPNQQKAPLRLAAENLPSRGSGGGGGLDGDTGDADGHGDKSRDGDKDTEEEADSTDRVQTELGSRSTESESRSTESESRSTESKLRLTESKLRLTESESRSTESESLTTESGSPLTESESLFTDSGSPLTESRSRLTESEESDGSAHANETEPGNDANAKVKAVEDSPLSLGGVGGKGMGNGRNGNAIKARVEGEDGSRRELPPPKGVTSSGTSAGLGEEGDEGGGGGRGGGGGSGGDGEGRDRSSSDSMGDLGKGLAMLLAQKRQSSSGDDLADSSARAPAPDRSVQAVTDGAGDAETDVPGALVEDVEMTAVAPRSPLAAGDGGDGGGGGGGGGGPGDEGVDAPRIASRSPSSLKNPEGKMTELAPIAPQVSSRSGAGTRTEPERTAPQALTRSGAGRGTGGGRTAPSRLPALDGGEGEVSPSSSGGAREVNKQDDGPTNRSRAGSGAGSGTRGVEPRGKGFSNGKGPQQQQQQQQRRSMLAPPMSPPKVVASAENDPQLDCTLKTLEAVHGAFYTPDYNHGQPRDVASFLAKVRSRVLRGVRMVFSGVIPVSGAPVDPRTHRLWKLAESHGAAVESGIGRHTTHVVAVRLGTAKTNKGLRMPGVFVVHLDWLMNSIWHCRRERETIFLLAGQICEGSPPPLPAPLPRPEATPSQWNSNNSRGIGGGGAGRDTASTSDSGGGGRGGGGGDGRGEIFDSAKFRRKRGREGNNNTGNSGNTSSSGDCSGGSGSGSGGGGSGLRDNDSGTSSSSVSGWKGWGESSGGKGVGGVDGGRGRGMSSSSSSSSGGSGVSVSGDGSSAGSDLDGLVDELENPF